MMMNTRKQRLAVAVAGAFSLIASTAQAADFTATTTLQNTLSVVSLQDFDIGTVFASSTGAALTNGVAAIVISADGTVAEVADSASVNLISLGSPIPAQGSVDMAADFNLQLPNTSGIEVGDFVANAGTNTTLTTYGSTQAATTQYAKLVHSSADPDVPSLYLVHFTIGDVSGGVGGLTTVTPVLNDGRYVIEQDFGETTYVFNIGATLTTEPGTGTALPYQEGLYSGTFEITASY